MKSKYIFFAVSLFAALSANAQETYENAKLAGEDLNGTARYVGMGGAMEALGADVSTIGSNPAGIGLFRHSNVSLSAGLLMQSDGKEFSNGKKTNLSFDQIGGVYTTRTGQKSFLNFGFNYHKSKNFDYILNAAGSLNGSSQNKQSYIKGALGNQNDGGFNVGKNKDGQNIGYVDAKSSDVAYTWSQIDYLYWNSLIPGSTGTYNYEKATGYTLDRAHTGYIGNYDFAVSGNLNDRVYLGLTFGMKDVNYKGYSEYRENFNNAGGVLVRDERKVTGSGFDITAGVIVRPVAESPFRIGAYVKSPTWYDLTTSNATGLVYAQGTTNKESYISNSYDFKMWTPWKFGFSLGHTIGNNIALGATYEYENYANINSRVNNGGYYDYYYDQYYESSIPDKNMNAHTKEVLKGVSTLKLGIEYKPVSNVALRMGYNYVGAMYASDRQKDPGLASLGTAYSSTTDYTNWGEINRFTLGVGYQVKKFNIDLAYQYSAQKGSFAPFSNVRDISIPSGATTVTAESNIASNTDVKNNRSQLLLTLGYRF
ncbi:OmpP1/FadL family transporter [Prevotella sp.]|uniref:OmpP1/FadL family transporter n=1 Tax=Prevotella sp. TaxID=59823 RepID=UPI001CB44B17|nr:hemin receptor [Prevotella sp.]MBF1639282.1 hemin receptor [Prevotella sp.]